MSERRPMSEIRPTLLVMPATVVELLSSQSRESGEDYADLATRYIAQGLEVDGVVITEQHKEAIAQELAENKERNSRRDTWDDIAEDILRGVQ